VLLQSLQKKEVTHLHRVLNEGRKRVRKERRFTHHPVQTKTSPLYALDHINQNQHTNIFKLLSSYVKQAVHVTGTVTGVR